MKTLRTPDDNFENLSEYPFSPNYTNVQDHEGGTLRIHYVEEGPEDADPVLFMHGEPSWSYLYRKMIPVVTAAGYRAVAPDLVGFGKSDKPAERGDYTCERHVEWMNAWFEKLNLRCVTLVCQDWGGIIGLRLVANHPDCFSRVVVANTGLPTGDRPMSEAFLNWRKFSVEVPDFDIGTIVMMGCQKPLSEDTLAAYNAPFPDDSYKEGARIFPSLVPLSPEEPAAVANRKAWEVLSDFDRPFVTMFSDSDPITHGGEAIFQHKIPGAQNRAHMTIAGGGHFLQEDCGQEFAERVLEFISET